MPIDKSVKKRLEENRKELDQNTKEVMGYGSTMAKIIDPNINKIDYEKMSINNIKSTSANLFNIKGKDKDSQIPLNELFYAQIMSINNLDPNELDSVMNTTRYRMREYSVLVKELPEIRNVLNLLADDVVYPNASGLSGIRIEFKNNTGTEGESDTDLIKYFRPLDDISNTLSAKRLYSFDIEKETKQRIKSTAIYGCTIVCTIPYFSIVNDLLYNDYKIHKMGESTNLVANNEYYFNDFQKDVVDRISESYDIKESTYKNREDDSRVNKLISKMTSKESHINFLEHSFYSQSDVDLITTLLSKESDSLISNNEHYVANKSGDIYDILNKAPSGEADDSRINQLQPYLEEIKDRKKLKLNIDKIKGCTTEILDLNSTLPLFIKDELMGVLLLQQESDQLKATVGSSLKLLMQNATFNTGTLADGSDYRTKMKTLLMQDLGDILEKNIDKKLLRNNPQLIEELEFLLENSSTEDLLKTKIRFVPAEYLTMYKLGDGLSSNGGLESNLMGTSMLEESKPYIHALIGLNKSALINEVFYSKPRYLFKIPHSNDAAGLTKIMDHVRLFRNVLPSLKDVGEPNVMNNSLRSYHTVLVPQLPDGSDLFTIEKLDTEYHQQNEELVGRLRNAATQPFGYPADVLDPSQQIDFAKKIANINMNTLIKVLAIQKAFTIPLSEECTKRLRCLTGNNTLEVIVTFDPPKEITDSITSEMLNTINNISEIYAKMIEEDPEIPKERKELMKFNVNKELITDLLGSERYEKVKKKTIIRGVPSDEVIE